VERRFGGNNIGRQSKEPKNCVYCSVVRHGSVLGAVDPEGPPELRPKPVTAEMKNLEPSGAYVIRRRVEKARQMLERECPATEAAFAQGFPHPNTLQRYSSGSPISARGTC